MIQYLSRALYAFALGKTVIQAAPIAITGSGGYSQDFDSLPSSGSAVWTDDSTLAGWYSQRTGSGTTIEASLGNSTSGHLYSYGNTGSSERALGALGSSGATAGSFAHGVQFQNTSATTATLRTLAYTGEQWRKSGVTDPQVVSLWYKINSSLMSTLNPEASNIGWTAIPLGDFNSPINSTGAGALDGNDPANRSAISIEPNIAVPAGSCLMIRWKDPDQSGLDHGLAIDNFTSSWITSPSSLLSPGAIGFVGFNADGSDDLAWVALTSIAANEVIYFTDNEWNGGAMGAGGGFIDSSEGVITWTAPLGGVAAGTVVSFSGLATSSPAASIGSLTRSGNFDLGASNETVYAYQGSAATPTAFLAMIATYHGDSTAGTGLALSQLIYLPNNQDVAIYVGSRTNQLNFASYLALLSSAANWLTEGGSGDQSHNGIAPDLPFESGAFSLQPTANTLAWWLSTYAPGENATQDHDQDGVANGIEYFMGAAADSFTALPGLVSGSVTWPRAAGTTLSSFKVEVSSDLSTWTDAAVTYPGNLSISSSQVVFTMPAAAARCFVRLSVSP